MTSTTKDDTSLWWSATGNLRCRDHLPLPGSASWWSDNWTMLLPQDRARITRLNGHPAACELCATVADADPAANAHAAYLAARAEVGRALAALAEHLDALDGEEDIDQRNWGFAGTLNHVAATLRDLTPSAKGGA